jgi:glycosyltransferase involved in cell wall biosynthesis
VTSHTPLIANVASKQRPSLSVIIPVLNEEDVLRAFYDRLSKALSDFRGHTEILFINDGSTDATPQILNSLCQQDHRVGVVSLSRRFGKEAATSAGIDHATGDALIFIDADLQDPPECIPGMIEAWQSGFDVVGMKRSDRSSDSWLKRHSAALFYGLLDRLSDTEMHNNVGDFRLISRRVADALKQLPERNRYMKGLFAWVGYPYIEIPYQRESRHAGITKWPITKLIGLALDGITAHSMAPLRIATIVGLMAAGGAFLMGFYVFLRTVLLGDPVAGFPTLMITITLLGGVQLLSVGLLGEYIGRMFVETKQRPLYFVESVRKPAAGQPQGPALLSHAL